MIVTNTKQKETTRKFTAAQLPNLNKELNFEESPKGKILIKQRTDTLLGGGFLNDGVEENTNG